MECYDTPWQLWRECRKCSFVIEPSFALGAPLSLSLLLIVHSFLFPFRRVHGRLQARGKAEGSQLFKMFELSNLSSKKEGAENHFSLKAH